MTKQEEQAVRDRLAKLENAVGPLVHRVTDVQEELNRLRARYEHHAQQGDLNVQMHCDNALALRQVSSALEDLIRRGAR
jgi:archaellum component FlaC